MIDRIAAILLPTALATALVGLCAYVEYCVVTHEWEKWRETVNTNTIHKWQMLGHYQHSLTTDLAWGVTFGVIALGAVILCAYWAEAWWTSANRR
jgi:hypothetical protein